MNPGFIKEKDIMTIKEGLAVAQLAQTLFNTT